MTIKKGLAVIDSSGSVIHKLMDDGSGKLGKTGADLFLDGPLYLGPNNSNKSIDTVTQNMVNYLPGAPFLEALSTITTEVKSQVFGAAQQHRGDMGAFDTAQANAISASYTDFADPGSETALLEAAADQNMTDLSTFRNTTHVNDESGKDSVLSLEHQANVDAIGAEVIAEGVANTTQQNTKTTPATNAVNAFMTLNNAAATVDTFSEIVSLINQKDSDNDTSMISSMASLSAGIVTESVDRAAGDSTLRALLSTEVSTRGSYFTIHSASISSEASTRVGAYEAQMTALSGTITTITSSYLSGDLTVSGAITGATSARISGDASLQSQIVDIENGSSNGSGSFASALSVEISTRDSAFSVLSASISAMEVSQSSVLASLESDLSTRASTRQDNIDSLISAGGLMENDVNAFSTHVSLSHASLSTQLSTADSARVVADDSVSSQIVSDKGDMDSEESSLSGTIVQEVADRASNHNSLRSLISTMDVTLDAIINTTSSLDEFSEIVNYINTEMSGADGAALSALNSSIDSLSLDIATERTSSNNADISLKTLLDNELSSMNSALASMTTRHNTYTTVTIPNLSSSIADDYTLDHGTFTGSFNGEKLSLLQLITDEENTRSGADASVQLLINAEFGTMQTAIVTTEATTRAAGDLALSSSIDSFLGSGFSGNNLTVTGSATIGDLTLGSAATAQIGTVTDPTPYASGDQTANNGMMFYLDMPSFSASGAFVSNKKWYFCENGVWHMSPFYKE